MWYLLVRINRIPDLLKGPGYQNFERCAAPIALKNASDDAKPRITEKEYAFLRRGLRFFPDFPCKAGMRRTKEDKDYIWRWSLTFPLTALCLTYPSTACFKPSK